MNLTEKQSGPPNGDSILMVLARKIKEFCTSERIQADVDEVLATRELKRRSNAWVSVYEGLQKAEGERRKLKPDVPTYNTAGEREEKYSAGQWDILQKLTQKIAKYEKALGDAYYKNEWKDVFDLAAQQSSGKDKGKDGGNNPAKTAGGDTEHVS